jgi:hypothetical protein
MYHTSMADLEEAGSRALVFNFCYKVSKKK